MKLPLAIAALTMIGTASVAYAQSNSDRPASPTPSSSAMPQAAPKETLRPLQSQLQAAKPGEAPAMAAPPQTTAFEKK
jgi:hypothetical protein